MKRVWKRFTGRLWCRIEVMVDTPDYKRLARLTYKGRTLIGVEVWDLVDGTPAYYIVIKGANA